MDRWRDPGGPGGQLQVSRRALARLKGIAALSVAVALSLPAAGSAQSPGALATGCATAGGSRALCASGATAAQSVLGHVGLLAGVGSEVSGTASTLGTRIGGQPRFAFSARGAAVRMSFPDVGDPDGLGEVSVVAPAFHVGVTAGLFDGLRIMPTVGGFLSVEAFGQASFLSLPESPGFDAMVMAYSVGLRVGVFREGFTVPGLSLSASRRFVGDTRLGDTGVGDPVDLLLNPGVTSVRATLGKDLYAVEVLAGLGWDDYSTDAALSVSDGLGGFSATRGAIGGSRLLYFGSVAMTFNIVLSLSVEGGWAEGLGPVASYSGAHDPGAGAPFGSFSMRLTL